MSSSTVPLPRSDTLRRVLFTLGALLAYRFGCHIPLPGIDTAELRNLSANLSIDNVSLFALGVTPILSALLIVELIKLLIPPLGRWEAADARNARLLQNVIYGLALLLAVFQAYGVANGLYGIPRLISEPGWEPYIAGSMVAGTMLLGWLGDRISRQGIGSGFWLLAITPTLLKLPVVAAVGVEGWRQGVASADVLAMALVFVVVAVALVATLGSARYEGVTPPANRASGADFIAVWPPLFAIYLSNFAVALWSLPAGSVVHLVLIAFLIFAFSWLQSLGEPLEAPAWRPAWIILLIQIAVCVGGEVLTHMQMLPFIVSGSWLIVVVAVAMNILRRNGWTH